MNNYPEIKVKSVVSRELVMAYSIKIYHRQKLSDLLFKNKVLHLSAIKWVIEEPHINRIK